jgi:hypothetical protein
MISSDARDPLLENLARLRQLSPDPTRAERVRATCREQLRPTRRSHRKAIAELAQCTLAPVAVGWFCMAYIAGLIAIVLRMHSGIN